MSQRATKRPRLDQRGEDDYLPGNIVEIELHNFMTYDHLKCKPASRLNLVVGPNGSGKSSLVCAIALGLAGDPQLLGRAASIGAYVKRGEESGYVRISLRGDTPQEKIVITRRIDTQNRSEWDLNGSAVPKRDIIDLIQRFNIQINNLTQFLPQDRVCEFAKLTPVQLLEETEKAVGNPELRVQHMELITKRGQIKSLELTVKQNTSSLDQLKALNAEQEKDVERFRLREGLLTKVEMMKKKLPWLKYDLKKMEYMEVKKQETEAKKKLDEIAKKLNDMKAPIEEQKKIKKMQESTSKEIQKQLTQNSNKRMEALDIESRMSVQVRGKYAEMEELRKQEENRQQRILKAKEDLIAAERELANLPIHEPPVHETKKLGGEILELNIRARDLGYSIKEKEKLLHEKKHGLRQCLERLKEMEDNNNKLLSALQNSGADRIVEAYKSLQGYRSELRKDVYGPVLLEVKVQNPVYAKYLEQHVPNYIWKAFITQDSADRDFLVRNLRSFDVPILNYVGDKGFNRAPFHISNEMHSLGICSRLDQVFDAPDAVKNVLIGQASLDHSYIGTHETDQRADEVSRLKILDLWTPESHYRWSISRYGGHMSATMDPVFPSRLFSCSVDDSNIEKLKDKRIDLQNAIAILEDKIKELQAQKRQVEDEEAKLRKQQEQITRTNVLEKKKRSDMERLIAQRRSKLESISKEEDIESSTRRLIDEAVKLNVERFRKAIQIKSFLVEAVALKCSFAEKHMKMVELEAKVREMEGDIKQHEQIAVSAASDFENCAQETKRRKQELDEAKRVAESKAIITEDLAAEFIKMPGTIEELEDAIEEHISQASSILFLNPNLLKEYDERKVQIETLNSKVDSDKLVLSRYLSEVDSLKEKWLPTLRNLVSRINDTFSRNFQEMAVAGEVSLDEHDMDFHEYGILIKVKFRQSGQLQVLSANHQSGGERSVSTILYLVSLQDLTNCPFRVVDEINQGMDPINERKMFQQLVRAASQPNTPQCFLLTPKLLPDLEYSDACSILNIMNGPWIEKPAKAWSNGECWRTVLGLAT